jgi:hypothetical protein
MPTELRHPTTYNLAKRPFRSSSFNGAAAGIPLDEESGLPKTFAHTAALGGNGHANGYGGWEDDDTEGSRSAEEDELEQESRLFSGGGGRDSLDVPLSGDMGASGAAGGRRRD